MPKKKRDYSAETRTERISRSQFREFLDWHWWLSDLIPTDQGEDEYVTIYDDGVLSGIRFFVQLKGTQRTVATLRSKKKYLKWRVTSNNLKRWLLLQAPVIIVIWNIDKRSGHWVEARDAFAILESEMPDWRTKKDVPVYVPIDQPLDDEALRSIRQLCASFIFPSLLERNGLQQTFRFTYNVNTEDGKQFDDAFEAFQLHGGTLKIDPKIISEWRFSEWYERLQGGALDPTEISEPIQFEKKAEGPPIAYRMEIYCTDNNIHYRDIRFDVVTAGTHSVTLSSEADPFAFKMVIRLPRSKSDQPSDNPMSYFVVPTSDVLEEKILIEFLSYLDKADRIEFVTLGTSQKHDFSLTVRGSFSFHISESYTSFISDLCLIQKQSGKRLSLKGYSSTNVDYEEISSLVKLVKGMSVDYLTGESIKLIMDTTQIRLLAELMSQMEPLKFKKRMQSQKFEVLGQVIEVITDVEISVVSYDAPEILETIAQQLSEHETIPIFVRVISGKMKTS